MSFRFTDPSPPKKLGPFRIGDRVRMPFGGGFVEATIVDDRGNLGIGGKRLYGVLYRVDEVTDENYTEREADQLTLVARASAPDAHRNK